MPLLTNVIFLKLNLFKKSSFINNKTYFMVPIRVRFQAQNKTHWWLRPRVNPLQKKVHLKFLESFAQVSVWRRHSLQLIFFQVNHTDTSCWSLSLLVFMSPPQCCLQMFPEYKSGNTTPHSTLHRLLIPLIGQSSNLPHGSGSKDTIMSQMFH